ncbi:MAG TPA: S8 family serine peptidase [Longimicrobium sp.]|nr:S8 family serine peptidase [Longimicrobium sp.]
MAQRSSSRPVSTSSAQGVSSPVEAMFLAALERGDDSMETGRFLVTFKEGATEEGVRAFGAQGMRVADARDFSENDTLEAAGDADSLVMPEIGVAIVGGEAARERQMGIRAEMTEMAADSPVDSIDPERFVFAGNTPAEYLRGFAGLESASPSEYMRGFLAAAETIAADLGEVRRPRVEVPDEEALVVGATWGLIACKVPPSTRNGAGIRVAVLDTGLDLGHPDFAGRPVLSKQFVGQPVQDLHGHGTHCTGTACGPQAPAGTTPRYGIGFRANIAIGKVLSNSGVSVDGSVLMGMRWAVANRCEVISMSLGGSGGPVPAYTNAGQAALDAGLLIIAAAGNEAAPTGSPANSPTIMSVASLDPDLRPSSFSNFGKIEIAGPGRDIFSTWLRPLRYRTISGTSMATPHVAGCAALWAQSSASLRGRALWQRLQATARRLPFPATRVGAGLVQAP